MPKNILIANVINVRVINNSLVRVLMYLTDNRKLYRSYLSHRSQIDVSVHDVRWGGDIGI
jgi:hypothetical protein